MSSDAPRFVQAAVVISHVNDSARAPGIEPGVALRTALTALAAGRADARSARDS